MLFPIIVKQHFLVTNYKPNRYLGKYKNDRFKSHKRIVFKLMEKFGEARLTFSLEGINLCA